MSGRRRESIGGRKWPTLLEVGIFLVTTACAIVGGFIIGALLAEAIYR